MTATAQTLGLVVGGLGLVGARKSLPLPLRQPAQVVGFGLAGLGVLQAVGVLDLALDPVTGLRRLFGGERTQAEKDASVVTTAGGATNERAAAQKASGRFGRLNPAHGAAGTVGALIVNPANKGTVQRRTLRDTIPLTVEVANFTQAVRDIDVELEIDTGEDIFRRTGSFKGVKPGSFSQAQIDLQTGTRDLPFRDETQNVTLRTYVGGVKWQATLATIES